MAPKKLKKQKAAIKRRVGRGAPKGKPPQALRRKKRTPKAVPPPPREVGLLDAIGEVMADVEELGQEMRDWADNMPESKQGGDKHSEVEQAADTLEEQAGNDPVTPEMSFLNDIKITIQDPTPRRRGYSRAARLGQAQGVLLDVCDKLEEYIGDGDDDDLTEQQKTAKEVKDTLDEIDNELQGVDFPGMYG